MSSNIDYYQKLKLCLNRRINLDPFLVDGSTSALLFYKSQKINYLSFSCLYVLGLFFLTFICYLTMSYLLAMYIFKSKTGLTSVFLLDWLPN